MVYQKSKLRGSCNFHPGSNPSQKVDQMAQAKTNTSTILDPSRRGFLAQAAAVAAGGAALGVALPFARIGWIL